MWKSPYREDFVSSLPYSGDPDAKFGKRLKAAPTRGRSTRRPATSSASSASPATSTRRAARSTRSRSSSTDIASACTPCTAAGRDVEGADHEWVNQIADRRSQIPSCDLPSAICRCRSDSACLTGRSHLQREHAGHVSKRGHRLKPGELQTSPISSPAVLHDQPDRFVDVLGVERVERHLVSAPRSACRRRRSGCRSSTTKRIGAACGVQFRCTAPPVLYSNQRGRP